MKKLIVQLMFAMVISVAVVSLSYAADLTESPTLKTIEGDLVKIEGEERFAGLQQFFAAVHRLTNERRLSRIAYLVEKPAS